MKNNFTWTDLSTFDVPKAKKFYADIFGWDFYDEDGYEIAHQENIPIAGIFKMPEYLEKINMPSFWMSYMRVQDVAQTVAKAKKHKNVIVEIEPTNFGDDAKIALIRDPLGAGFTVYEGKDLQGRFDSGHGRPMWNTLHVDSVLAVKDFYEDLFDWNIKQADTNIYEIIDAENTVCAHIEQFSNATKGPKQYWMPVFGVEDIDTSRQVIINAGGKILWDLSDGRIMFADNQGGAFLVTQTQR